MHDPLVVAFEIRRPWPQRSGLPAAGDGVRWRIRLHHDHHPGCLDPTMNDGRPCTGNPFPWWRLRSYSAFWRLAGRDYYWPPLVTIWHREPGGHDALSVCSHRYQDKTGAWHMTRGWRWHVIHAHLCRKPVVLPLLGPVKILHPHFAQGWRLQIQPLQHARRYLLTRCEVCGGKSRKGHRVNLSHSWDRPKGHWWQGERGLSHMDCSTGKAA